MKKEKTKEKTTATAKPEEPGIFLWALFVFMLALAIFTIVCGVIQTAWHYSMWGVPPINIRGLGW